MDSVSAYGSGRVKTLTDEGADSGGARVAFALQARIVAMSGFTPSIEIILFRL